MGLGGILAEMQITRTRPSNGMPVLMHVAVAMNVTVGVAVVVVMMSVIVVVVMVPIMVMMMIVIIMVMGMQVLVVTPAALAVNANVLRPAAAYLAHGYLPLLLVEGLLADGSPA
ncbi:conserved protein of unknown function [Aminobacter niigataensis]|nr:conserved protein of unknown function [Aminobacter niigataensis]